MLRNTSLTCWRVRFTRGGNNNNTKPATAQRRDAEAKLRQIARDSTHLASRASAAVADLDEDEYGAASFAQRQQRRPRQFHPTTPCAASVSMMKTANKSDSNNDDRSGVNRLRFPLYDGSGESESALRSAAAATKHRQMRLAVAEATPSKQQQQQEQKGNGGDGSGLHAFRGGGSGGATTTQVEVEVDFQRRRGDDDESRPVAAPPAPQPSQQQQQQQQQQERRRVLLQNVRGIFKPLNVDAQIC